ncbi:MAG: hypothetical protein M3Y87_10595, partial [Myxococcota bacterium]|nr:hypothetical protein [Myxococcota bacterium]
MRYPAVLARSGALLLLLVVFSAVTACGDREPAGPRPRDATAGVIDAATEPFDGGATAPTDND